MRNPSLLSVSSIGIADSCEGTATSNTLSDYFELISHPAVDNNLAFHHMFMNIKHFIS